MVYQLQITSALATWMLCSALIAPCSAQTRPATTQPAHHVVIDVTTDDPHAWPAVLNAVATLQKTFATDGVQIEVVGHNAGIALMAASQPAVVEQMTGLINQGAAFVACRNSMRQHHMAASALNKGVTTVDSGTAEIVRKEEAGWSYIKAGE